MARQCSAFFDLEKYQEQRAAEAIAKRREMEENGGQSQRKITKQELEMFKKRKLDKKRAKIRAEYAD